MNNARNILVAIENLTGYTFQVYGVGEPQPDVETTKASEAMEHVEAQDETEVLVMLDGECVASINIVGEDGEFEVFNYGADAGEVEEILDNGTRED